MKLFSGMQPSGEVHLGNYLGAIKNWVELQKEHELMLCIVDLHAITVPQDPDELRCRSIQLVKLFLACGIDPEKTIIFRQSDVAAHSELAWILSTLTSMGELNRMTQFKDKSQKGAADNASAGLFTYPVLQAADVLLYDVQGVPVGEDQRQHLELTRDLAQRFNNKFGPTFTVPEPMINKTAARVMSLNNPDVKMSKSAGANNYIALLDGASTVAAKLKRAVTDSKEGITADKSRKGLYNLLAINAALAGDSVEAVAREYADKNFAEYKACLADLVSDFLSGVQDRYNAITDDDAKKLLETARPKAEQMAARKMTEVMRKLGLN